MSHLRLYSIDPPSSSSHAKASHTKASLESEDVRLIQTELKRRGIRFERWPARQSLAPGAEQDGILRAYRDEITAVQASGDYATVDAIRINPDHPDRVALRAKFLEEHTHADDEVRFFVEGQGLFCLHINGEVIQVLCCAGDWIAVPAGTKHWFDMGSRPSFCAIRFFNNPEGWVARFTGDPIARLYPRLD